MPFGPGPEMAVPGTGGQVVIQIFAGGGDPGSEGPPPCDEHAQGDVDAHSHGWGWRRNYFRNYWRRNCWRNHCYR